MCIASASNVQYFKSGSVYTTLHFIYQLLNGPSKLVFHCTKLERLARDEHSCLLDQFVSHEENEVLRLRPLSRPYEDIFEEIYSLFCKLDHFCAIMKQTNFQKFGE
jgi:hypothetical protein